MCLRKVSVSRAATTIRALKNCSASKVARAWALMIFTSSETLVGKIAFLCGLILVRMFCAKAP
jgi:hypothetical protein